MVQPLRKRQKSCDAARRRLLRNGGRALMNRTWRTIGPCVVHVVWHWSTLFRDAFTYYASTRSRRLRRRNRTRARRDCGDNGPPARAPPRRNPPEENQKTCWIINPPMQRSCHVLCHLMKNDSRDVIYFLLQKEEDTHGPVGYFATFVVVFQRLVSTEESWSAIEIYLFEGGRVFQFP